MGNNGNKYQKKIPLLINDECLMLHNIKAVNIYYRERSEKMEEMKKSKNLSHFSEFLGNKKRKIRINFLILMNQLFSHQINMSQIKTIKK